MICFSKWDAARIHPRTIEFPVIANQRAGFSGNPHLEKYMVSMTREIPTPVTSVTGEPVEKPVIANQSAFLVWQSPNFSGPKLIGSALKLGDSHASVRYFLGMTLAFLTH